METQYRKLSPGKKESGGFRQKTRMHSLFPPFVTQEVKSVTKVKKKNEKKKQYQVKFSQNQMEVIKWLVFLD